VSVPIPEPVDKFPFFMVLTSYFLQGAMFLLLSAPIIVLIFDKQVPPIPPITSLVDIFSIGYPAVVEKLQSVRAEALSLSLIVIASFVVGMFTSVLDRAAALGVIVLVNLHNLIRGRFAVLRRGKHFTALEMADKQYPKFLSLLMDQRRMHAHWEWELFNYYTRWSLFTQVFLYFAFCGLLIWKQGMPGWDWLIASIAGAGLFGFVALKGCVVMRRVHDYYLKELKVQSAESLATEPGSSKAQKEVAPSSS
jgi:hypothetical protein